MRNVTIYMPLDVDAENLALISANKNIPIGDMYNTIGYLSQWAINGYSHVFIAIDKDGDISAHYLNENKDYHIGAVWHDDHYGFHS